ncbi:hypothetical protein NHX12_015355 [Muraenolepis orangiensis]|uniref:Uncharacterized protein n=1 Tax=Muraenolepis orangiensis TaxID=630683 RepID=A0A9Q0I3R2_9TELE|nr:hypothetical protein NHX12_015355 [Muraenolepis orangiensis]
MVMPVSVSATDHSLSSSTFPRMHYGSAPRDGAAEREPRPHTPPGALGAAALHQVPLPALGRPVELRRQPGRAPEPLLPAGPAGAPEPLLPAGRRAGASRRGPDAQDVPEQQRRQVFGVRWRGHVVKRTDATGPKFAP